jgi:hypothetical protein
MPCCRYSPMNLLPISEASIIPVFSVIFGMFIVPNFHVVGQILNPPPSMATENLKKLVHKASTHFGPSFLASFTLTETLSHLINSALNDLSNVFKNTGSNKRRRQQPGLFQ